MKSTGEVRFSHASGGPTRGSEPSVDVRQTGTSLRISETFTSRQGEGKLTGVESFFVRTSGCNLRCWFCDTPYASWNPEGDRHSIDQIIDAIERSGLRHVVLTGGEPLLPGGIVELCQRIRNIGLHITIETAGTIDRELPCNLMSISPKLATSTPDSIEHPRWAGLHATRRMPIDVMRRLIDRAEEFQVKFVIGSPTDYDECVDIIERLQIASSDVWIMPQGTTNEAMDAASNWLAPWCERQGYQYCDRMQIRWYGNRRGT